jgi:murein DD-endopeptidase MepM/ murein hydrolase activator NlpD
MLYFILKKVSDYLVFLFITLLVMFALSFALESRQTQLQILDTQSQAQPLAKVETQKETPIVEQIIEKKQSPIKSQQTKIIKISNFPVKHGFLSSPFGMRKDPIHGHRRMHSGIDIAAARGTKIYPMGEGKVIFAGYKAGYGNTIEIRHGHSVVTRYSHLKEIIAKKDQQVSVDDVIGHVGNTGRSTGPHLHLEVAFSENQIDPQTFLAGQIAAKSRPPEEKYEQASLAKVSYQDYLQSFDGLYGLKAPDQMTQYR